MSTHSDRPRIYIAYDSRATPDSPEDANVLEVLDADDDREAVIEAEREWRGQHAVVFSYRDDGDGKPLADQQFVGIATPEFIKDFGP